MLSHFQSVRASYGSFSDNCNLLIEKVFGPYIFSSRNEKLINFMDELVPPESRNEGIQGSGGA